MTDVPVATVSRAESPVSPGSSPSPPAVVPSSEKSVRNQQRPPLTKEQRKNEEFAFAKFLSIEEQRLRKNFPHLSYRDIEKKLVAGWMKMKPAQRLKYLDSENTAGQKEKEDLRLFAPLHLLHPEKSNFQTVDEGKKASLKRKLDEQFDCRLKLPSLKTATTGAAVAGIVKVPGLITKPATSQKQAAKPTSSSSTPIIDAGQAKEQRSGISQIPRIRELPTSATPTSQQKIIMEGRVGKILLTRGTPVDNNKPEGNFAVPSTPPVHHHHPTPSRVLHHNSAKEALDNYYLALCAPAFPHPDEEPLTPHSANYYLETYQRLSRY